MNEAAMTPEQEQHHKDLIRQYGVEVVRQARELSGLTVCLTGLALDTLKPEERARLRGQASHHLANLLETLMTPAHSAKVTECAKRIDSALDLWMADEMERRGGLPPL